MLGIPKFKKKVGRKKKTLYLFRSAIVAAALSAFFGNTNMFHLDDAKVARSIEKIFGKDYLAVAKEVLSKYMVDP
ncbi:hypothetical protein RHMOL_Rhmol08G0234300 [Rhododendron molle]|uniref:Uncharacterized protein n=1 Tax=Rhododendron molle TaxID=49168 RepID=A0ACC0MSX5_RHOML|nr:hypothetical protein RHMOL_Rhmol08G0234300 [Rhododendron molle]